MRIEGMRIFKACLKKEGLELKAAAVLATSRFLNATLFSLIQFGCGNPTRPYLFTPLKKVRG